MKILVGVIGFLIFAASIPSASQTADDGRDQARVYFFDRTLKSTGKTYSCDAIKELATTDKVGIVKGLNETQNLTLATIEGRSEFTLLRPADAPRIRATIESASQGLCQQVKHQNTVKAANAATTKAQLDAALARQNALNAQLNGGTPGAGSSGSSAAGGLATGAAVIGLLKEMKGDKKDTDAAIAENANAMKTQTAELEAARSANALVKPAATVVAAKSPDPAAASGVPPAAAHAQLMSNPIKMGNADVNFSNRSIKLTSGENQGATYTWSDEKGVYTSPGKADLSVDAMVGQSGIDRETLDGVNYVGSKDAAAGTQAAETIKSAGATNLDALAKRQNDLMDVALKDFKTRADSMVQKVVQTSQQATFCNTEAQAVQGSTSTYVESLRTCAGAAIRSDNVCTISRSPKAQQVSKFMSLASLLLAKENSASNNCRGAGYYAGIAQAGMTVMSLACSGTKMMCDGSCDATGKALASVNTAAKALLACGEKVLLFGKERMAWGRAQSGTPNEPAGVVAMDYARESMRHGSVATQVAAEFLRTIQTEQQPHVTARVTQCQKYAADILDMGIQIISLAQNRKEAKACKEALARTNGSGGTDGGTGNVADLTMDQLCAQPGQAAVAPCKCRNQPTAEGCPGFVADTLSREKLATNGAASAQMGMAGTANMANVGGITGSLTKMNGAKKSGLSAEAREALGLSDMAADGNSQGSSFGGTNGTSPITDGEYSGSVAEGDGSGTGEIASDSKSAGAKKADSKDKFGKFESMSSGSMGGGFGGFGSFGAGRIDPKTGKKITEQQAAIMVQRKIAAQELQEQVTTASGKSNWDKVRERYGNNLQSLYDSP